jgi:hypothetical protein
MTFEDASAPGVDLHLPDDLEPRALEPEIEPSDPGE